jgi:hypothetical protein
MHAFPWHTGRLCQPVAHEQKTAFLQPNAWGFSTSCLLWVSLSSGVCSLLDELEDGLHRERLGALDRKTERAVPDELRQRPNRTASPERNCIEVKVGEAVVVQERSGGRLYVRRRRRGAQDPVSTSLLLFLPLSAIPLESSEGAALQGHPYRYKDSRRRSGTGLEVGRGTKDRTPG